MTLPLIAPAVIAAALLTFALSIDDFVITNFNAGSTVTYPLYIWGAARVSIPPQVNVLAAMIFLFTLAMMLFTVWQQRRAERLATVWRRTRSEGSATQSRRGKGQRTMESSAAAGPPVTREVGEGGLKKNAIGYISNARQAADHRCGHLGLRFDADHDPADRPDVAVDGPHKAAPAICRPDSSSLPEPGRVRR